VVDALAAAAEEHGRALAREAHRPSTTDALRLACAALAEHGYEPRVDRRRATLANCPFHSLARSHTDLVCRMNLSLIDGVVGVLAPGKLETSLDPADGRCCVTLAKR
jgi:predicted ArsR family transcriptional regulator